MIIDADADMKATRKTNWKEYNELLVKRGEILISSDALRNWKKGLKRMNKKKKGRPFLYPNNFIRLFAMIRVVFRVPYRQLEGIAKAFGRLVGKPAPDHTTFFLRIIRLRIPRLVFDIEEDDMVIAVDSSRFKATNRGEWMRRKKKGYVKLHIAVDVKTKQVIAFDVTDERTHDSKKLQILVKKAGKKANIKKVLADSGYDTKRNYQFLFSKGIYPGIKPKGNARPKDESVRADVVQRYKEDALYWKKETGYGKRAIAENFFSVFKRLFGEAVMAKRWERIVKEIQLMIFFYNLIIAMRGKRTYKSLS